MSYSDKVLDHYSNPRNVGSMDKSSSDVGTGLVGAPECGDVMKLQIKVNRETNVIEDAKFKTFGCGSAIASSSLATEWVKGKTVDEALLHQRFLIVQGHAVQIDERLRVHEHAHVAELEDAVTIAGLRIEADVVAQARTSSALYAQAQAALLRRHAFLGHGDAHLGQGFLGHEDAFGRCLRGL